MGKNYVWAILLPLIAILGISCQRNHHEKGFLRFTLSDEYNYPNLSRLNVADTNDFILSIVDSDGAKVYYGSYGERPQLIEVTPGTYVVSIKSEEFDEPAFEKPIYGCEIIVMVNSGENIGVKLVCFQINSGLRIEYDKSFKESFYGYNLYLEQDEHNLPYPFNEHRWGYFNPGMVKMYAEKEGNNVLILTRMLSMSEMLSLKLYATQRENDGFSIVVDTTRLWINEDYLYGSGNDGSSISSALRQDELGAYLGAKDVWVEGFIVGGDVSNSSVKFDPPFTKLSNLAISSYSEASTREECSAVELTTTGGIRAELNLVENPENLGKKIIIKGNVENYFGSPGIKSVKEYYIEK